MKEVQIQQSTKPHDNTSLQLFGYLFVWVFLLVFPEFKLDCINQSIK